MHNPAYRVRLDVHSVQNAVDAYSVQDVSAQVSQHPARAFMTTRSGLLAANAASNHREPHPRCQGLHVAMYASKQPSHQHSEGGWREEALHPGPSQTLSHGTLPAGQQERPAWIFTLAAPNTATKLHSKTEGSLLAAAHCTYTVSLRIPRVQVSADRPNPNSTGATPDARGTRLAGPACTKKLRP